VWRGAHDRGKRLPGPHDRDKPLPAPHDRGKPLPDLLPGPADPPPRVLFCGINPGMVSAATGHHFARPGNRFWPALHLSGFTPTRLRPDQQDLLPSLGLGITNLVDRPTARADQLTAEELTAGGERLRALTERTRPRWLAVVGVTAYRVAFGEPKAAIGPRDRRLGDTRIWVLPNPSGLNAHWTLPALAEEFRRLRAAAS
jgi:TDG/mug DNA glycosylase family protein